MKQQHAKLVLGLLIIFGGINLIPKALELSFSLLFSGWWALLLSCIALASTVFGSVNQWVVVWLFSQSHNWLSLWLATSLFVGGAIIILGLLFLLKSKDEKKYHFPHFFHTQKKDDTDAPSYSAVFSGMEMNNSLINLSSCTLLTIFGGSEIL
jgi:hypothetical protein